MNITAAALFTLVSAVLAAAKFKIKDATETDILASLLNEANGMEIYPKLDPNVFELPANYVTIVEVSTHFPELKRIRDFADSTTAIFNILKNKVATPAEKANIDANLKRDPELAFNLLAAAKGRGVNTLDSTVNVVKRNADDKLNITFGGAAAAFDSRFFAFDSMFNYATKPSDKKAIQKVYDNDETIILELLKKATISAGTGDLTKQIRDVVLAEIVKLAPTLPSAPAREHSSFYTVAKKLQESGDTFKSLRVDNFKSEFSAIVVANTEAKYQNLMKNMLASSDLEKIATDTLTRISSKPVPTPIATIARELVHMAASMHLKVAGGGLASIPTRNVADANAFILNKFLDGKNHADENNAMKRGFANLSLVEMCAKHLDFPVSAKRVRTQSEIAAALKKTLVEALVIATRQNAEEIFRLASLAPPSGSLKAFIETVWVRRMVNGVTTKNREQLTSKKNRVKEYLRNHSLVLTDIILQQIKTTKNLDAALIAVQAEINRWAFN
jgi:hypothetical protein